MIKSISLKNVALYKNEAKIENLNKINFIYGSNGSGKTTLTNFLKNTEDFEYKECKIIWENSPKEILVYNKKFRDDNFSFEKKIPGIFTIGKENIEIKNEIERLNIEISKKMESKSDIENKITKLNAEKEESEKNLDNILWEIKNEHEELKNAFVGNIRSKRIFAEFILGKYNKEKSYTPNEDTLENLNKQSAFYTVEHNTIEIEINKINLENIIEIENNNIWNEVIVGKTNSTIAKFIDNLVIHDWVYEGKKYIKDNSDVCPFCQNKTIDENFRKQLNEYFDLEYENKMSEVTLLKDNYIVLFDNIKKRIDRNITDIESINNKIDFNISSLKSKSLELEVKMYKNIDLMNKKVQTVSKAFKLEDSLSILKEINKVLDDINDRIQKFNKQIRDKKILEKEWRDQSIEEFCNISFSSDIVKKNLGKIDFFNRQKVERNNDLKALEKELKDYNKELIEKQEQTSSVDGVINNINRNLKSFGFSNFSLIKHNDTNDYELIRNNGELAIETLSEGEITFITVLYFLELVKGSLEPKEDFKEKVIVIDDPISSLDSTILFIVSTLIKKIISDIREDNNTIIKQIIVLTHNIYFHKEVSFIDMKKSKRKDTYYWMLIKEDKTSKFQFFEDKNPIKTGYESLWNEVKETTSVSSLQNIMRKIIETYFKLLGGISDDEIIEKFNEIDEKQLCRSLLSWINDGSHTIPDDLDYTVTDDSIEKYKRLFKEIFIKSGHEAHYDMMMK